MSVHPIKVIAPRITHHLQNERTNVAKSRKLGRQEQGQRTAVLGPDDLLVNLIGFTVHNYR